MKSFAATLSTLGIAVVVFGTASALAYGDGTPDGSPPAEETTCDGLRGAARGLCIAYCEANDCDLDPDAADCEALRKNYEKITGEDSIPCEEESLN